MENIEYALMLMVVGLATVFVILLVVINLGKLLITLVNKCAPEEAQKKSSVTVPTVDAGAMDAIKAAAKDRGMKKSDFYKLLTNDK